MTEKNMMQREMILKRVENMFLLLRKECKKLDDEVVSNIISDIDSFVEMHKSESYFLVTRARDGTYTIIIEDEYLTEDAAMEMFTCLVECYIKRQITDDNDYDNVFGQKLNSIVDEVKSRLLRGT